MANPLFVHVQTSGDIFISLDPAYVPAGTSAAIFRTNSQPASQKIGTVSGVAGSYAVSSGTGKYGKEVV
jgi:hypothetical protein